MRFLTTTALTAVATLVVVPVSARAQSQSAEDTIRLAQQELTEMQAQIKSLKAQVADLQVRLAQQEQGRTASATPAATDTATAQPRAAQNATTRYELAAKPAVPVPDDQAQPRIAQNSSHRLSMQSADGQYSIALTGDVQFDGGAYLLHPASPLSGPQRLTDGVNARRARIGVTGTAPGGWGFALVWDAGNSSDQTAKGIETAQIVYGGVKGMAVEAGYSNTFFTLDQATGSNDLLFLERSTPTNIATSFNTGDARSNVGIRFFGDRYWVGGYLTGPASGDSHTLTQERFGAFERVAVQAIKTDDATLHLGVGFDQLLAAPNSGNGTPAVLTLSDQPEMRIDPTVLVTTGTIGTAANPVKGGYVLDLETAGNFRNFFWQGEYYHYAVERIGLAQSQFDGAYGQISWTITGESHAYNPQAASYFRIVPRHNFSLKDGTWGAFELAARYDTINLNSNFTAGQNLSANPAAVDGGTQRALALGLNWYPNDLFRVMLDYNHITYDKANGTTNAAIPLGSPVGAKLDEFGVRLQVAY
jgi:phosphate-selective porin OprO/OprP